MKIINVFAGFFPLFFPPCPLGRSVSGGVVNCGACEALRDGVIKCCTNIHFTFQRDWLYRYRLFMGDIVQYLHGGETLNPYVSRIWIIIVP